MQQQSFMNLQYIRYIRKVGFSDRRNTTRIFAIRGRSWSTAGRPAPPLRRLSFIVGARYTLYQLDSLLWRHNEPTISSIVDIIPARSSRSVLRHCSARLLFDFSSPSRPMLLSPSQRGAQLPRRKDPLGHDCLVEWSTFQNRLWSSVSSVHLEILDWFIFMVGCFYRYF